MVDNYFGPIAVKRFLENNVHNWRFKVIPADASLSHAVIECEKINSIEMFIITDIADFMFFYTQFI